MTQRRAMKSERSPRIFMMDLWATVPYYTAYLSKALLNEGADVQVGSITYYLDRKCFTGRGIRVDPGLIDVVGKFNLARLPRRILKTVEALVNLATLTVQFAISAPDVIHIQYLPMLLMRVPLDFWFLEFCRRKGTKLVLTVHDLLPHDTAETHKRIFQELYLMVDGIICHSNHVRTRLATEFGIAVDRVTVIPHGPFFYDLPASSNDRLFIEDDPTNVVVLWQGIIFPYKGVDFLLEAWLHVEASGAAGQLIIAGTGSAEILAAIQEQIARLALERVQLHARFISSEELVALYRRADVVVYPYRAITTSGALATGLALGKTIVASDLPVFRELLTNEQNSLLVDPQNKDELATALLRLIQDAALREQLAANIRALNFGDGSWLSIAKKTMRVYEEILFRQT